MRWNQHLKALLLFGMMLSTSSTLAQTTADAGRLPSDWYMLPEDGPAGRDGERGIIFNRPASEQSAAQTVDTLLNATALSLDRATPYIGDRRPPGSKPANWVPWHLKEIILDLGVSAQGMMGLITGKGAVSAEVYWRRTKQQLHAMGIAHDRQHDAEPNDNAADLAISPDMSEREMALNLDPVVRTIMATGRIQNESRLRAGLVETAKNLQELMSGVNDGNRGQWHVNKFRLDVSVSGSGMVQPGVAAGAAVRLRFEWKETQRNYDAEAPQRTRNERQENLRQLLGGLADDLETVDRTNYAYSGFELTTFRAGIGMFFKARFGVVKGELGAMGYAFFVKSPARFEGPWRSEPDRDDNAGFSLIDLAPRPNHIAYAKQQGVRLETLERDASRGVVYSVSRQKFRKGLQRAARMGAFFAQRAQYSQAKTWQIDEVRPQFALSLMGVAGVVTIGGTVSLEMHFRRANQN